MAAQTWKRQAPNALTMARLVMAAGLVALLANASALDGRAGPEPLLLAAAVLFIVAAATDALDGYLARKWNAISIFGRVMDPFADKLLVLGTIVMLVTPAFEITTDSGRTMATGFTGWMAVVILGRELLVTSIRGVFESRGIDFSASASGKAKMILQSVAIPACLLAAGVWAGDRPALVGWAVMTLAWGTTLVTAFSAVPYIQRALRVHSPKHIQENP